MSASGILARHVSSMSSTVRHVLAEYPPATGVRSEGKEQASVNSVRGVAVVSTVAGAALGSLDASFGPKRSYNSNRRIARQLPAARRPGSCSTFLCGVMQPNRLQPSRFRDAAATTHSRRASVDCAGWLKARSSQNEADLPPPRIPSPHQKSS
jgi:hypothetical protein